jgi:hypothetical protein
MPIEDLYVGDADGRTYVDELKRMADPSYILEEVLKENPGLATVHSPKNTVITFATPERIEAARKSMEEQGYKGGLGFLEYWPIDEEGTEGYGHPAPGKVALEIFSQELKDNPTKLKQMIYSDLLHGMDANPEYKAMRDEFKSNFTPEEVKRITSKQSWWEDANNGKVDALPTIDAYIRGYLSEPEVAMEGQNKSGETMYSPKQLEILGRMNRYIKTGKIK